MNTSIRSFQRNACLLCLGFFLAGFFAVAIPTRAEAQKSYMFWIKPTGVSKAKWSSFKTAVQKLKKASKARKAEAKKLLRWKKFNKLAKKRLNIRKKWKRKKASKNRKKWKLHKQREAAFFKRYKKAFSKAKQAHRRYHKLSKQSKRLARRVLGFLRISSIKKHMKKFGNKTPDAPAIALLVEEEMNHAAQDNPIFQGAQGAQANAISK